MEIIISPIHRTFFAGRIWSGLDIERIAATLTERYEYKVSIIDFADVAADYAKIPQGACWFYSSSYDGHYARYIRDVITDFTRSRADVVLIPDLDQLFSYENKGYQELYKKRLGIELARGRYYGDQDDFTPDGEFNYPFVLKKINGAVSSGVTLIRNKEEFDAYIKSNRKRGFIEWLRFKKRWYRNWKNGAIPAGSNAAMQFDKFFTKRFSFVIQEFAPDLDHDYKVLVFGQKYYVMRRNTRPNDFRASGSGKNEFVIPPPILLDYAEEVSQKLDVPFCSLDIVNTGNYCALVEYQGIGFGIKTLTESSFYFTKTTGSWERIEGKSNLEEEYARAITEFLAKKN